jgi:hypothetical protein
VLHPLDAA